MGPRGRGSRKILVIGEAPGKVEDRKGMPWQGRTGRLLQRTMAKLGVALFDDCLSINAVNCRPPNNRAPSSFEVDCCREVLVSDTITNFKPHIILLLGTVAIQSFYGNRWKRDLGGVTKWSGFAIPDQEFNAWVIPTFHPSYVMRIDSREANVIWEQHLKRAFDLIDVPVPRWEEPRIKFIEDLTALEKFHDYPEISFDYETTGLKAQRKGHRIICASVAGDDREVYAFMMPDTKIGRKPFLDLLADPNVGKMAHNMKFEHTWTWERYGVEVQNWQWDSMLAAHQLDNRAGVTGLKFQTYANFGVMGYDDDVAPYLRRKEDSGNGFNSIYELLEEKEGKYKLLKYCALDSHYEYLLAKKQMKELDYNYLPF